MIQNWKFQRGDIFFTRFDNAIGSEQSGNRPAVVLQNDVGNFYSPTLIVATWTSKAAKKYTQPTHCLLVNDFLSVPSIVQAEQIFTVADFAFDESNMMFTVKLVDIAVSLEIAVFCRHIYNCFAFDQLLVALAVVLQIFDCDEFKIVFLGKFYELRCTHHGSVFLHDFAAESTFLKSCQSQQINCCFCVAVSFQNTVFLCFEREHVSRAPEVFWL